MIFCIYDHSINWWELSIYVQFEIARKEEEEEEEEEEEDRNVVEGKIDPVSAIE